MYSTEMGLQVPDDGETGILHRYNLAHTSTYYFPIAQQEHVKHLLDHRTLDVGIRNSSGRDAVAVAARYGRESLTSRVQARFASEQRRRERRMVQAGPTRKGAKQARRGRHRRRRLSTHASRKLLAESSHEDSASSNASQSCAGMSSRVDDALSGDTTIAGVLIQTSDDSKGFQEALEGKDDCRTATKEALGAIMAGSSLPSEGPERGGAEDGTESTGTFTAGGSKRKSVQVDGAEQRSLGSSRVHPQPNATRAVAVQTDCVPSDAQGSTVVGRVRQIVDSETIGMSSTLRQGRDTVRTRLQRRLTAPGDLRFHALDASHLSSSIAVADTMKIDEQSNVWRDLRAREPAQDTTSLNDRTEEARPLESIDSSQSQSDSSSSVVLPTSLCQTDVDLSSAANADKQESPSLCGVDRNGSTDAPETESTAAQQQEDVDYSHGECEAVAEEDRGVEKNNLPSAIGSEIDDVTRQLQQLLREDALQDDGEYRLRMFERKHVLSRTH